jgi:FHS family L-fucose permease-like MFS transporter
MLIQFSFFGAYFVGSLVYFWVSSVKGDPIIKLGYKKGIRFLPEIECLVERKR